MTEKKKKSAQPVEKQTSLLADFDSKKSKSAKRPSPAKAPATDLMKTVAAAIPVKNKLKKSFSESEIKQILSGQVKFMTEEEKQQREAKQKFKIDQKRIKRVVLEMETSNRDKLIFYKSSFDGRFYKALDTSALYYAYRLADRMSRKCNIMVDSDRFSKALYVATVSGIEKFIKQFEELEGGVPDITLDGVYIFPLKNPITDEDLVMLRQTENTKRDKVHNILKPKRMSPAVYQQILMIIRQLAPRSEKLRNDTVNYRMLGDEMLRNLIEILTFYTDYANGVYTRKEMTGLIFRETGKIKAALTILGETRKWGPAPLVAVGNNINILEQLIEKDLEEK